MRLVVDASVAIKWLLNEAGSPHAREFLERFRTGQDDKFAGMVEFVKIRMDRPDEA